MEDLQGYELISRSSASSPQSALVSNNRSVLFATVALSGPDFDVIGHIALRATLSLVGQGLPDMQGPQGPQVYCAILERSDPSGQLLVNSNFSSGTLGWTSSLGFASTCALTSSSGDLGKPCIGFLTAPKSDGGSSSSSTIPVVAGVLGGLGFIAGVVVFAVWYRRRRRRRHYDGGQGRRGGPLSISAGDRIPLYDDNLAADVSNKKNNNIRSSFGVDEDDFDDYDDDNLEL